MRESSYVATLRAIRDRLGVDLVNASDEERQQRVLAEIERCPQLARIVSAKLGSATRLAVSSEAKAGEIPR